MRRPYLFLLVLAILPVACRRQAEPSKPPPQAVTPTPAVKKGQLATVADLIEKFKTDRKPPPITTENLLQDYDDGRTIGDRIYRGEYVWLTGPIAKIDSYKGKRTLFLRDARVKRSILVRAEFVNGDLPLLMPLKNNDIVTVWGRIRGMPEKEVLLDNGILLTDERRSEIQAAMKK